MDNNKICFGQIKNEIASIFELSDELSCEPECTFNSVSRDDAINLLYNLYSHLKTKSVDESVRPDGEKVEGKFYTITRCFADLKNIGASYTNKNDGISNTEIRKFMLERIGEFIKPIEEKYEFSLKEKIPEFNDFIETGLVDGKSVLGENPELEDTNPPRSNFNFSSIGLVVFPFRQLDVK